ncbi:BspA family leucine-rich repeat surface protein [Ruminococcus sp.]|uniref:BspA family leucine-rich repeat surface protein n=1 Tax=Ruminococcus sp. TaxID=41978 RepID=UPI0025D6E2DB|nr:BspA family leucine-rich repeat surface protein [Ruminococcus sp.]
MKNKWKKAAAFAMSLALVVVNSASSLPNSNMIVAKASDANSQVSEKAESESVGISDFKQGADETYFDSETKTLHLKGYVRNGGYNTGLILPMDVDGLEVKHLVADEGTVLPEDCCDLCYYLPNLETIDLKNADTSNVTDMSYMFVGAGELGDYYCTLDLSNFDTSNVTNMHGMFSFRRFNEIVLDNFDTSKVTDVSGMFAYSNAASFFENCRLDTSNVTDMSGMFDQADFGDFDLSCLDTSNVTDMSWMFSGAYGESYDFSSFNTSNVTNMTHMFSYAFIEALDLSDLDTSNVTDMSGLFCGTSVVSLNLGSLDTSSVTDMSSMFGESRIDSLDLSGFDTSNVTDMSHMFSLCDIQSLDLSNFDTSNVTDMSGMFDLSQIESFDLSSFDTSNVTDMSRMFVGAGDEEDDSHYIMPDISNFNTSNVTDMSGMFWRCSASSLDLSNFDTSNVTDMSGMFLESVSLESIIVSDKWSTESVIEDEDMFYGCAKLQGGAGTVYDENHVDVEYAHVDGGEVNPGYLTLAEYINDESYFDEETGTLHLKGEVRGAGYYKGLVLPKGTDRMKVEHIVAEEGTVLPEDCSYFCISMPNLKSVDLKNADSSNVTDMSYMFALWDDSYWLLSYVDVSGFDTSKVTDMTGMFRFYHGAELDVSSFDTSNVTNMSGMFCDCEVLSSIDVSGFDTRNVTDMSAMFGSCYELEYLDLSNFDTSNVTDMKNMFSNCRNIETIIVGAGWSTKSVKISSNMFRNCEKLKGGAGTVYNENHTDANYARIDGGKLSPGYFTSVNGASEEDTTIVIVIPEETMNAISYLYNNINNPTLKNIASTAMNFLGKYFSFKIV